MAREGFQVEVYVGPMLELVLGGVLEAFWSDLGKFLGGQDGPKTPTKRPKTPQDAPRRDHDGPRLPRDAPKMLPRRSQDAIKTEADARCASEA